MFSSLRKGHRSVCLDVLNHRAPLPARSTRTCFHLEPLGLFSLPRGGDASIAPGPGTGKRTGSGLCEEDVITGSEIFLGRSLTVSCSHTRCVCSSLRQLQHPDCLEVGSGTWLQPHAVLHAKINKLGIAVYLFGRLTVVVDGVDKPDSHVRVVVRHQHDVEQFFALRVQIPQTCVYGLQRLSGHETC